MRNNYAFVKKKLGGLAEPLQFQKGFLYQRLLWLMLYFILVTRVYISSASFNTGANLNTQICFKNNKSEKLKQQYSQNTKE